MRSHRHPPLCAASYNRRVKNTCCKRTF
jgi:hypothetical protein